MFRVRRARIAYFHDVFMAAASFVLSQYLRLGDDLASYAEDYLFLGTSLFAAVAAAVFASTNMYRGIWRYASLNDMLAIVRAASLTILIFLPLLFLLNRLEAMPRSALLINWFVLAALLGGPRILYRIVKDRGLGAVLSRDDARRVPILLVGAGDSAELFIRSTTRSPGASYHPVGIVDDRGRRVGRFIHGVEVMGDLDAIPEIVQRLQRRGRKPRRLVIARQGGLPGETVRRLFDIADDLGMTLARAPEPTELQSGVGETPDIRPIAVEDLLGRPQAVLDRDAMRALIAGRRVLVTGAGGTIGGELVRQIAELGPARLTLLDNSEYALWSIDRTVGERRPDLPREALLADIRDRDHVAAIVAAAEPDLVFHAAALKHVHVVEAQPVEGIRTNVIGTRNVADACRAAGVGVMVLVSTDKAVNPSSVMGATKRLAEAWCQALDLASEGDGTRFVTVRFGNVLGSTGSVVEIFRRQLAQGVPLTVTHPDVTRWFMTVREAVELVLQASALGAREGASRGHIHVLDMGDPVRIEDLARQMIRLSGRTPDEEVRIVFTGLGSGEKLHEELLHAGEDLVPAGTDGLLLAAPRTADHLLLARGLDELAELVRHGSPAAARAALARLVPEYRPAEAADAAAPAAG